MTDLERHCSMAEDDSTKKRRKIISIISIILFVVFMCVVCLLIGGKMIHFFAEPDKFRDWVQGKGFTSRIIFVGMVAFQIIVAIIPGEPLEIGAGYAFGVFEGTLLCMLGILVGSIIVFWFSRIFGVKAVEAIYPREKLKKFKILDNPKKLNLLTFILFVIPGTPKDVMTYFIGLTPMKFGTWVLITCTARIPSVITSTIGGNALGLKDYTFAVIAFAVTIVISIIGILLHRYISRKHEVKESLSITDESNEIQDNQ